MSNRYHQKRRGYSPSRSRSYDRDRDRDKNREQRYKDDKEEKRRYDDRRGPREDRQHYRQHHVSIDWKPKREGGYRHNARYSNSRSYSSSSSSSSSYSSSYSRSNSNKRGYVRRDERKNSRRRSNSRHRDKGRYKDDSRSRSPRKKQYQSKRNDDYYDKYSGNYKRQYEVYRRRDQHRPGTSEKQSENFASTSKIHNNKDYVPGVKAVNFQNITAKQKQEYIKDESIKVVQKQASMIDEGKVNISVELLKNSNQGKQIIKKSPPISLPQPIKRESSLEGFPNSERQKEKVSKVTQLISKAKKNLQIRPLTPSFLILDSYRTMKKFNAETLDYSLLSVIQRDFQANLEKQKVKLFKNQVILGERQNARLTLPSAPSDEELSLRTELDALKISMMNLNHLFRQLHVLQ